MSGGASDAVAVAPFPIKTIRSCRVAIVEHVVWKDNDVVPIAAFRIRISSDANFKQLCDATVQRYYEQFPNAARITQIRDIIDRERACFLLSDPIDFTEENETIRLVLPKGPITPQHQGPSLRASISGTIPTSQLRKSASQGRSQQSSSAVTFKTRTPYAVEAGNSPPQRIEKLESVAPNLRDKVSLTGPFSKASAKIVSATR